MADPRPSILSLLQTQGIAPNQEQYDALIALVQALSRMGGPATVGRLSSLFLVQGVSEGIRIAVQVHSHEVGHREANVLLPLVSGRNLILSLFAFQEERGQLSFHASFAEEGSGAILGIGQAEAMSLLEHLFSLLPDPAGNWPEADRH